MWYETDRNELVLAQMLCLEGNGRTPKLGKCHEMGGNQEWRHKGTVREILIIADYSKLFKNKNKYFSFKV